MTWLPGNRNSVPLSFTFNAKCTSVFQLLQPMSIGAKEGEDETEEQEGKCVKLRERAMMGKLCWRKIFFAELTGFIEMSE